MNALESQAKSAREHTQIYEDYKSALTGAGPKLKELILDRAAQDRAISFTDLRDLVRAAYPEGA